MKRILLYFYLMFSIFLVSGCTNSLSVMPTPKATNSPLLISDYYPFIENTKYLYEGKGNEYASFSVTTDYIKGNRIQLRKNNGGTEVVTVLEYKDGMLTMLSLRGETYFREDLTNSPSTNTEVLLKEPLEKGTSWTLTDGRKRYISNVDVPITTPPDDYKTIEVTTEGKGDKTLDYYAQKVGLVKTVLVGNDYEVSSALSKIESNVPFIQSIKFFYPSINDNKLYFVNMQMTFNTNDITKMAFEKAFKDVPKDNTARVLSPNAKIKSMYLNKDNMVYIDFNKELVSEMNAGAGYEALILRSITNTIGTYYGVDKVYITVEGNPYASGHFEKKKGEYFKVDLENTEELIIN